jgi:hypothetical protein
MSRRFKGRHAKVQADPKAKPAPAVELTDENSERDPFFPDIRYLNEEHRNKRHYARASVLDEAAAAERKKAPRRAPEA